MLSFGVSGGSMLLTLILQAICFMVTTEATSSRFIKLPESQTVVEGERVEFVCEASEQLKAEQHSNPPQFTYSWLHNGRLVRNSTRVYQINANLYIDGVRRDSDLGDYVCVATSDASGARQAAPPAKLNVIWIQTATVQLLSNTPNELTLKCHVEGSSGPHGLMEIEWFRNSQKLTTIKNILLAENRLIVSTPSSADSGLYRCVAANEAGRVMSSKGYVLRWSDADKSGGAKATGCIPHLKKNQKLPEGMHEVFLCRGKRGNRMPNEPQALALSADEIRIFEPPESVYKVKETEPFSMPCTYELSDKYKQQSGISLRWRKDGKIVRQIELNQGYDGSSSLDATTENSKDLMLREDTRLSIIPENGTLVFSSVMASDAGLYMCQLYVEGRKPITSDAADLQVIEVLKFMPQPTSKNLELGTMSKVHCKAQGTPMPQVKWIKDFDDEDLPDLVEDIGGTLTFRNVSSEHRGNYTCIAFNKQGQINATVSINVGAAPKFVVLPNGPIETQETGTAMLHCQASGDPKPTIKWDKDLRYLSENNTDRQRFRFFENGTLAINDVQSEDEGLYGCTIGNSAGLKREEVRFIVKGSDGTLVSEEAEGFLITRAVLITMTVAFAYIILVVGLMVWCRYRRQARKARLNDLSNKENVEAGGGGETGKNTENDPCLPNGNSKQQSKSKKSNSKARGGSGNEAAKSDDTQCSQQSRASKRSHAFDQLALPRSAILELIQIGRGDFGDVFVGKIKASVVQHNEDKDTDTEKHSNSDGSGGSGSGNGNGNSNGNTTSTSIEKRRSKTSMDDIEEIKEEQEEQLGNGNGLDTAADEFKLVLVKALNKIKDENVCQEFKRQIEMLRAISHKGVVRLYGLCRERDPHYMVLEYTDWGDLKQFLLATAGKVNTSTNSSSPPPLKTSQVLAVAYQIARGMDAIYRARFIHKDLATRNCVISSDFIVKVSYPALSKDKYNREYFKHRNTLLPIRWLAPECIQEDEYTTKSDIFAFSVVVWELFNQATKIPFEELSNEEVVQRSQNGKLEWQCAENTPSSLKEILTSCWHQNPKQRPSFSQLSSALSKAMQNGDK